MSDTREVPQYASRKSGLRCVRCGDVANRADELTGAPWCWYCWALLERR